MTSPLERVIRARGARVIGVVWSALLLAPPALPAQTAPPAHDCTESRTPGSMRAHFDCATLAAIDVAAEQFVVGGRTPGLTIGIMRAGRLLFHRSYGLANLESAAPVTAATVFPTKSVSKLFTAAAVMQLRDAGRLSLDDPLSKYLPSFPRAADVTIRQLLSHRSGIADYVGDGGPRSTQRVTSEQVVGFVAESSPLFRFQPGARNEYSNSNYALLGRVVEVVSGRSYRGYVTDSIIKPAGLRQTAVDDYFELVPGRAVGYLRTTTPFVFAGAPFMDPTFSFASGAIRSTVAELATWITALFEGRVVRAATVREMSEVARLPDGSDPWARHGPLGQERETATGLGVHLWRLEGHRVFGHHGGSPGFSAVATYYPDDDFTLVIFSNASFAAYELEGRVAKLLFGGSFAAARTPVRR